MRCDEIRLEDLLNEAETDSLDAQTSAHLSDCARCQARLLSLAGDDTWWREAQDLLRAQQHDPPVASGVDSSILVALDSSLSDDLPATCESVSLDFLSPPSHPEMLGRLGRYEIESVIGSGGMGVVLRGFDTELHRPVAIKVLAPHLAGSGAARARFAREAQAVAAIAHEHVLPVHNVESSGKLPYLVMPFIAGSSLQVRLDRQGPLAIKDVVRIALQTAQGLSAAHAQGIVHRDVKPANILLEEDVDRVRITDFGLARAADDASVTRTGILAGTPQYMSPEQTRGEPIDPRSDLFSLGSVMYAMCTGRPPFRAETTMGVLRRISDDAPRPPREVNSDVPEWLETIILRLLAKPPGDRYASAAEVAGLLEQCLAHLQHPTSAPLPVIAVARAPRAASALRKRPLRLAASALLLIAVGLSLKPLWFAGHTASTEQSPSSEAAVESSAPAIDVAESIRWHDGVEQQLDGIRLDMRWIETDTGSNVLQPNEEGATTDQTGPTDD